MNLHDQPSENTPPWLCTDQYNPLMVHIDGPPMRADICGRCGAVVSWLHKPLHDRHHEGGTA